MRPYMTLAVLSHLRSLSGHPLAVNQLSRSCRSIHTDKKVSVFGEPLTLGLSRHRGLCKSQCHCRGRKQLITTTNDRWTTICLMRWLMVAFVHLATPTSPFYSDQYHNLKAWLGDEEGGGTFLFFCSTTS
ncbi:hypothetical protein EDC04DRAFT_749376 [Pisolithus marmoratus]|nr:hypothetical protein EDC04DRAFT_749376 [Pisolithus marmoratus]